jgi:hypothetical protein
MKDTTAEPLEAVAHVDLQRYLGKWYEIATIPQRFQKGCVGVTAEYTLRKNGDIRVVNTCVEGTLEGKRRQARGKARVVDKVTNAKLKVTFFWPFWGAYWIIGLDEDYRWAVVGRHGLRPDRDLENAPAGRVKRLPCASLLSGRPSALFSRESKSRQTAERGDEHDRRGSDRTEEKYPVVSGQEGAGRERG